MKCVCDGCKDSTAYCDCQWGTDGLGTQQATFCREHAEELWEMLNPLLQLNKAWYRIDAPGAITGQKETPISFEEFERLKRKYPEYAALYAQDQRV